jgi:flap endonuclease-1
MGIKQLSQIVKPYIKQGKWSEMSGKVIAIDASIYMYRFQNFSKCMIFGFIRQVLLFRKNGIIPFYIFDGAPPEEKNDVIQDRKEKRKEAERKKVDIENKIKNNEPIYIENRVATEEEVKKMLWSLENQTIRVNIDELNMLKIMFDALGVPYYTACGEAEWFCSKLNELNIVDACLSEDTDMLPNGTKMWIKNYKADSDNFEFIMLDEVLKQTELSHKEFQDMCIIMGCDYLKYLSRRTITKDGKEKIYIMGPRPAFNYAKKYRTIENFLKSEPDIIKPEEGWDYERARYLFNMEIPQEYIKDLKTKMDIQIPKSKIVLGVYDEICTKFEVSNKKLRVDLEKYLEIF